MYNLVHFSPANDHNSSRTSTVIDVESRRRSSSGLQRQSSICIPDSDENLDIIITSERNILADIGSFERLHGGEPKQHQPYEVSQNSSLDMDQEPTQVSVEVHRGCGADATEQRAEGYQNVWIPESKESCGRTMDLEDYHYSQLHGASNVANWLLGDHKRSASSYDVKSTEVVRWRQAPQRTTSVESSDLEELMENRRKKNSHVLTSDVIKTVSVSTWSDDDDEPKSKVRYNDTGSKEEVNEDVLDLFVGDIDLIVMDDSAIADVNLSECVTLGAKKSETSERISAQYRELWQLRATLEEEDLSDVTCFEDDTCDSVKKAFETGDISPCSMDAEQSILQDSSQLSVVSPIAPNVEMDSTTPADPECKDAQQCGDCLSKQTRRSSRLLELPSCHSRRQSYKSILTRRMHQADSSCGQTTSLDSVGPSSTENSFDSIETVDTEEGSTTDASRPEAISTSFESTTDNTDSPGESHAHNRLQQMKSDSGYKSLETQNSAAIKAPRLSKKKLYFVLDDVSIENVPPEEGTTSIDEGVEVTEAKGEALSENVAVTSDPQSPGAFSQTVLSDMKTLENSLKKERARKGSHLSLSSIERKEGKSASKKRREYMKERQPSFRSMSVGELSYRLSDNQGGETDSRSDQQSGSGSFDESKMLHPVGSNPKASIFLRFFRSSHRSNRSRIQFRDYSIDEKSDSLFREFSRHDPTYETSMECLMRSRSPRLHQAHSARRFHHRCRQMKHESGSPRTGRRKLSPQDSIEEETSHAESEQEGCESQFSGGSASLQKSSDESLLEQADAVADIPVIKLIQEESSK